MTFTWTTIHVRDLDQSLAFYHDLLGLPIQERSGPRAMRSPCWARKRVPGWSSLAAGRSPEHPAPHPLPGVRPGEHGPAAGRPGGPGHPHPAHVPNPALQFYFLEDPDGYTVQLVEYVTP